MKVSLVLFLVLFVTASPLSHPQSKKTAHPAGGYREQDMLNAVKQLEDGLRIAVLKGDPTWWNAYLSDEYSQTDADGKVLNKAETIQRQSSKYLIYEALNFSDRTVHTFNLDAVIVSGKMIVDGTNEGQSISGTFQFTRVWVKQGLEWKLASFQMTRTGS